MEPIDSFFQQFRHNITTKVLICDKREQILIVDENDKYHHCPHKIFTCDLAVSAIDFAYDPYLGEVFHYLLLSKAQIQHLKHKPDDKTNWEPLWTLANTLFKAEDLHPYYYPILTTIVNLYKRNMRDANGNLVEDDILVKLGVSLIHLQENIRSFLDTCSLNDEDERIALKYYLDNQYHEVEIRKVILDLVPLKMYEGQIMKVVPSAVLHPETPTDIWNYLLPEYIKSNLLFRRCNNCLKYFVTTGVGNPKYCDRIVEGTTKTCRQLVAKEKAHTKNTTNPINITFNRTYKTMYSRVSAGKLDKEKFHQWAEDARQVRDKCERGVISLEDFSDWLENSRTMRKYR